MLSPFRLSVCLSYVCLSSVCDVGAPYSAGWNFRQFFSPSGTLANHWHSLKILRRSSQGTPPSGYLNARRVVKYSDFDIWNAITSKRCKIGDKLVLITNRKSYMGFRLVPKLVTLNDLERRNGHFCVIITVFGNFKGVLRKSGWQSHNYMDNLRFTIYDV